MPQFLAASHVLAGSINTGGLATWLTGLVKPLFLAVVAVMALGLLFSKRIMQFMMFLAISIAVGVVFFFPVVIQDAATAIAKLL